MITDSDAEHLDHVIVEKAEKDGQYAIAYGLLLVARGLNAISSTVGHEGMLATKDAAEKIANSLDGIATSIDSALGNVANSLDDFRPAE